MKLVKCIELCTKELEKSDMEIIERNIAQLDEIETKGLERINDFTEKLNIVKENFQINFNKLKQIEHEKLKQIKDQQENDKRDLPVLEDMDILKNKDKSYLMAIKSDLDKKMQLLISRVNINRSKIKNGAELKCLKFDSSILKSSSEIVIQLLSSSILVIFYVIFTKIASKTSWRDRFSFLGY